MPNFVKFGQSVAKILRLFDFSRWRPPPYFVFEIVNFYLLTTVFGGLSRITVPNFVKIGRSVTDILQFFEFSGWPPPLSWIFENVKFYSLLFSRVARRISVPNCVKIGQSVAKILRFFDFSRWRPPPYCIFEIVNVGICGSQTHHCTKFRHNRTFLRGDIAIFRIFKMATAAVFDF